jgi:thiamine-phosphate pyrophosphorylase
MQSTQIYLITPKHIDLETFPAQLSEAMAGGDIAALLIDCDAQHDSELQKIAQTLAPLAQAKDIAVVLRGDSRIAGRTKCDGLHLDGDVEAITEGAEEFSNRFMTGAEGSNKRHEAMERGESSIDYIMFGRLQAPETEEIYPQSLEMADWWSTLFEVPAVILSGTSLDCCEQAAKAGIEFIALRSAVWDHPQGPQLAIQQANSLLAEHSIQE